MRTSTPSMGTDGRYDRITLLGDASSRIRRAASDWPLSAEQILQLRSVAYALALASTAAVVAATLTVRGFGLGNVPAVATLAVLAAIGERGQLQVSSRVNQSISPLPTLFAAVLFGPLAAMAVGACSMIGTLNPPYLRIVAYSGSRAITGACAGLATWGWFASTGRSLGATAVAAALGATVTEAVDTGFLFAAARVRQIPLDRGFRRSILPISSMYIVIYSPIIALLAYAYEHLSAWILPLFLVPAIAAQQLYRLYLRQRNLTEDLAKTNVQLEAANLSFATALVAALDARDEYTAGHSAAVAIYARDIAARLGLPLEEQNLAHLCGLVHDIGKIGLPPGLLEKPGPLTLEERRQMEQHSVIGERILAKVDKLQQAARIVRHHHERVDGEGYPDRLRGDTIPLLSRILAVADAYNAMTSDRPYREAMPSRVARLRLAQAVETQFDTNVVVVFESILAAASEEYRDGTRSDFELDAHHPPAIDVRVPAPIAVVA